MCGARPGNSCPWRCWPGGSQTTRRSETVQHACQPFGVIVQGASLQSRLMSWAGRIWRSTGGK